MQVYEEPRETSNFKMLGHQSFNQSIQLNKQNDSANDPWARFYQAEEDDYVFTIEQLPDALKKMEQEEKQEGKTRLAEMEQKK